MKKTLLGIVHSYTCLKLRVSNIYNQLKYVLIQIYLDKRLLADYEWTDGNYSRHYVSIMFNISITVIVYCLILCLYIVWYFVLYSCQDKFKQKIRKKITIK